MDCYFCIISLPAESVADLCVLKAGDDGAAMGEAQQLALDWTEAATISLYRGERLVEVLRGELRKAA